MRPRPLSIPMPVRSRASSLVSQLDLHRAPRSPHAWGGMILKIQGGWRIQHHVRREQLGTSTRITYHVLLLPGTTTISGETNERNPIVGGCPHFRAGPPRAATLPWSWAGGARCRRPPARRSACPPRIPDTGWTSPRGLATRPGHRERRPPDSVAISCRWRGGASVPEPTSAGAQK
jgi:hypothetical protein